MPALDTNVILRYVVEDDPSQTLVAQRYIERHVEAGETLFLATSVVLETESVLRSVYRFSKDEVIGVFVGLLESREMRFQDEESLERAVHLYRELNIDFADCLHLATAQTFGCLPLATFERKARDVEGFAALRV
ncbi:MAG: type II toxin-antitoxin system VapC family toxin [Xanthomonadales bacterium]|nr:type II toxin-antitoxin system VapC family toxin [Xanthomonadales bacterium]